MAGRDELTQPHLPPCGRHHTACHVWFALDPASSHAPGLLQDSELYSTSGGMVVVVVVVLAVVVVMQAVWGGCPFMAVWPALQACALTRRLWRWCVVTNVVHQQAQPQTCWDVARIWAPHQVAALCPCAPRTSSPAGGAASGADRPRPCRCTAWRYTTRKQHNSDLCSQNTNTAEAFILEHSVRGTAHQAVWPAHISSSPPSHQADFPQQV